MSITSISTITRKQPSNSTKHAIKRTHLSRVSVISWEQHALLRISFVSNISLVGCRTFKPSNECVWLCGCVVWALLTFSYTHSSQLSESQRPLHLRTKVYSNNSSESSCFYIFFFWCFLAGCIRIIEWLYFSSVSILLVVIKRFLFVAVIYECKISSNPVPFGVNCFGQKSHTLYA